MMLYTTLNRIKKCGPCGTARDDDHGFRKLLTYLSKTKSDDEQLSFKTILESNGLDDAIWCLRSVEGYDREIRLFSVSCARRVEHLDRTGQAKKTNDIAERFANGLCTIDELNEASDAALRAGNAASRAAAWACAAWYMTEWESASIAARAATWAAEMVYKKVCHEQDLIKMFCTEDK